MGSKQYLSGEVTNRSRRAVGKTEEGGRGGGGGRRTTFAAGRCRGFKVRWHVSSLHIDWLLPLHHLYREKGCGVAGAVTYVRALAVDLVHIGLARNQRLRHPARNTKGTRY